MSYKQLVTSKKHETKDDQEHIYYNIQINNIYRNTEAPIVAQVNDQTSTILSKQSDYECTVTFWSLRGQMPVFICPVAEGTNANINLTPFGVSYSFGGLDYPAQVVFVPETYLLSLPLPKAPNSNNGIQDLQTNPTYYYVWTFQDFLDMVNTALNTAYIAFNAVNPGVHNSPVWFQYDSETGLISLIAEYSYANQAGADVFCNYLLLNYFEAIQVYFFCYDQVNFKDFRFIMDHDFTNRNAYALPGATIPLPPAPPAYIQMQQEYECRYTWANIRSILFTSSSIQTRDEFIPQINNPNAFSNNQTNNFNPNFLNILSYYDIIFDSSGTSGANWRQYLFYNPQIYRWLDLVSDDPLRSFNINIYLQLTNGQLVPLLLPVNNSVDIKLLFRKKK